jgi:hypothetical protein
MEATADTLQENTYSFGKTPNDSVYILDPKDVKTKLWKIYRLAVIGKSHAVSHLTEEDIALLFDQLIKLVEATSANAQSSRATLLKSERSDRHD